MVLGGKVGVNIFILITGYFLITNCSKILDIRKIIKLWGQIIFYSLSIFAICSIFKIHDYEIITAVKSLFPITFSSWWFASTYFVLYIIHPFLNILLNSLSKKTYQIFLTLLIIMWSVIPTFTTSDFQSNPLWWFVTLYALAGYVRLYGFNHTFTTKRYFIMCGIFSLLTYLSSIVFTLLGTQWNIFSTYATYFYGMEKIPVLLISLTLFLAFTNLQMNYTNSINTLATATFGVYLIHENIILRPILWINIFQNYQYQNSLLLIPYSIIVVLLVYAICTVIDLIRQKFFEKPFMVIVDKYADNLINALAKIYDICKKMMFG
ncbi:acyltransferase family protein [Aerococcus sanguinicola]|uniref:acyltransferase family protein n=1 Tax=Aerococcus sanguinicola TaxID=119206 RepID=UPI00356AA4EC